MLRSVIIPYTYKNRIAGFSYYANATSLSPEFYQTLLDRCWRRSGKLLYRPNQRTSCCPHYTIRLDSALFAPSRDQRQAVNRFNKYVLGDDYVNQAARLYPKSREEIKKRGNEFNLSERIHEAEYGRLKMPPEPAHNLVVTLEENNFTEEKYIVYDNYQRVVHGDGPDERTRRSFERFLCRSPLKRKIMIGPDGRKRRLGSFHQCYRLDGELVAIGVLDLLPECVSSVYFLYHESIHKFSPGKLGALHEISLALEDGYRWWYPGFYIHNCPKMRYKIDYSPQCILNPDDSSWLPLDKQIMELLSIKPHASLSAKSNDISTDDIANQPVLDGSSQSLLNEGDHTEATSEDDAMRDQTDDVGEDEEEDEDEDNFNYSLFKSGMPGALSLAAMQDVDLDHIALRIFPTGPLFKTSDLVKWGSSTIKDASGIKPVIAELVAVLGPDLIESICLDMVRRE